MTQLNLFDGVTYNAGRDGSRLNAQLNAVRRFMYGNQWHTLAQIAEATGHPQASVSARLRDLRKPRFGSYRVDRRYVARGKWEYRLMT